MMYFGTSNPGELFNGAVREGQNLFASSIVAIDLRTGEYRWHFQQVHHDLWDYDAASPVVLFDIELDGELRHAIAEPNKNGFVYVLDRETGEPLLPIEERPVPQDESQRTWPTQPFPVGDAFVPQEIPQPLFEQLDEARAGVLGEWEYVNGGEMYTPPTPTGAIAKPATLGGANWPPSSFSPDTGFLYVCASDTVSIFATEDVDYDPSEIQAGRQFLGSAFANPSGAPLKGTVTAMDMTDNRIAWQQRWDGEGDNCYSGMLSTAGGLVFVGRNDGRLIGYDAADGTELWSYQTGAGANAPAVSYELDGRQHVALLSGGNALAGSPQGDIVTVFALDGDLDPLPEPAARTNGDDVGKPSVGGT
jgi:alcohol dehydrogenase (cytochrome c)